METIMLSCRSPQPEQDMFTEAVSYGSFDAWLSNVSDERLKKVLDAIDYKEKEMARDKEADHASRDATLAALGRMTIEHEHMAVLQDTLQIAHHYRKEEGHPPAEANLILGILGLQAAMEMHIRNGIMEKQGTYSMRPDGTTHFTLTPKGYERYGGGQDNNSLNGG